jgi:hypothetical protein
MSETGEEQPTEFQLKLREIFRRDEEKEYLYRQLQEIINRLQYMKETENDRHADICIAFRKLHHKIVYIAQCSIAFFACTLSFIVFTEISARRDDRWVAVVSIIALAIMIAWFLRSLFQKIDDEIRREIDQ